MENEVFPLDDAAIALIAEIHREMETLQLRAHILQASLNGALSYFARMHGLEGPWKLAENKRELARVAQTAETANDGAGTHR